MSKCGHVSMWPCGPMARWSINHLHSGALVLYPQQAAAVHQLSARPVDGHKVFFVLPQLRLLRAIQACDYLGPSAAMQACDYLVPSKPANMHVLHTGVLGEAGAACSASGSSIGSFSPRSLPPVSSSSTAASSACTREHASKYGSMGLYTCGPHHICRHAAAFL